jgi:hypothetical protein
VRQSAGFCKIIHLARAAPLVNFATIRCRVFLDIWISKHHNCRCRGQGSSFSKLGPSFLPRANTHCKFSKRSRSFKLLRFRGIIVSIARSIQISPSVPPLFSHMFPRSSFFLHFLRPVPGNIYLVSRCPELKQQEYKVINHHTETE